MQTQFNNHKLQLNGITFLIFLITMSNAITSFAQKSSIQTATFSVSNKSIFGPGAATSIHKRLNLFADNGINSSFFTNPSVDGVACLDQKASNTINDAIDVVNTAIDVANLAADPDIPKIAKLSSYCFGGKFDIKLGMDFDTYADINIQGGATNITYPAKFTFTYPNNNSFGCNESFYISTKVELKTTDSKLQILDPLFEFKLGAKVKAGIYGGAQLCFGPCSSLGSAIDYGNSSFKDANDSNFKTLLSGGEYDLFKISSTSGISFPWNLYSLIPTPSGIPNLTLPLTTSLLGNFESITNIKGQINNPFTNLDGVDTYSGNSILDHSLTDFFNVQFDPIQYTKYLTGIPLQISADFGAGVSADFTAASVPLVLDAKQDNSFQLDPQFPVDLDLGRTLNWEEQMITETQIYQGNDTLYINLIGGAKKILAILPKYTVGVDTVLVKSGNSQIISNFTMGNLLLIKNYPDKTSTNVVPTFKMNSNFSSQFKEKFDLSIDLKLAEGHFNFPAFNISTVTDKIADQLNITGQFKDIFKKACSGLSSISSSGAINFGPFPQPTPSLDLASFEAPIFNTSFAMTEFDNIQGTAFTLKPDTIPPVVVTKDITINLSANTLTINPIDVVKSAIDNEGGKIQYVSVTPNSFDCSNIGTTTTVQVTISDGRCNLKTLPAKVTIIDTIGPVAKCNTQTITVYINPPGNTFSLNPNMLNNNSTGNCISSMVVSKSTFNCSDVGKLIPDTLFVTDIKNRTSNCLTKVSVMDSIKPVAKCKLKTTDLFLSSGGNVTVPISIIDSTSLTTDNCTIGSKTLSRTFYSCSETGKRTVIMTVADGGGNTSTCTATVNVRDTTRPVITCPANVSVTSCVPMKVFFQNPAFTDNCNSGVTITQTAGLASGSTFAIGTTTNTFHATDASNNTSASCSFNVVVSTVGPPTINCPPNSTLNTDLNPQCGYSFAPFGPSTGSPCNYTLTLSLVEGIIPGEKIPFGITNNVWKVTDQLGNSSTCSFTYTVIDNIKPNINCPADINVTAAIGSCTAVVNYSNPIGSDNCFGTSGFTVSMISGLASGSSFPKGNTPVTYQVTDYSGNSNSCTFNVNVVEQIQAPKIVCPGNVSVATAIGNCESIVNFIAPVGTDNCSGTVTEQIQGYVSGSSFPKGSTTNTFNVTDDNGLSASCSFTVTVIDTEHPEISCPDDIQVDCQSGLSANVSTVNYDTPVGTDNCTCTTNLKSGLISGSQFPEGITTVTYEATDDSGLKASCQFSITVVNCNHPPVAHCKSLVVDADENCQASITADQVNNNSSDPDNDVLTFDISNAGPFSSGDHYLKLIVTDPSGLSNDCSFLLRVIDNTPPVAPVMADITIAQCEGIPVAPNATDNCSGIIKGKTTTMFPITTQGTTTVIWTFDDGNGNITTANQNITVLDNTAPATPILNDVVIGECNGTPLPPLTTDNCAGIITGTTTTIFPITTQGTTNITWTFDDGHGNSVTSNQNVIVKDITPPVPPLLRDTTLSLMNYTPQIPIAVDFCSGNITGTTTTTFPITNPGITIITWTFDDSNGNISTSTQKVIAQDNIPPVTPVLADIVVGECSGTPPSPQTTDNTAGIVTGTTSTLFPITKQGVTVVSWLFEDGHGNSTTANQNVIVKDVTAPVLPQLNTLHSKCSLNVSAPTTIDNCSRIITAITNDPLTYNQQGNYIIHWNFDDGNGNIATANQSVIIKDNAAPVAPQLQKITAQCQATVPIPTASDNCSGLIYGTTSSPLQYNVQGVYQIDWKFDDQHGNVSHSIQTVEIKDISAPVIPVLNNVIANCSTTLIPPMAMDNCAGNVLGTTDKLLFNIPGIYSVIWKFNDGNGNTSNAQQQVKIVDNIPPKITCPNSITKNADAGKCGAIVNFTEPVGTDNCTLASTHALSTYAPGSIFPVGSTLVSYEVVDAGGLKGSCSFTILIVDNQKPVLSCPANQIRSIQSSACNYTVIGNEFDLLAVTDNCGVNSKSIKLTGATTSTVNNSLSGITINAGITNAQWQVKDANANTASCNFTITVNRNADPIILNSYILLCNDEIKMKANTVESGGIGIYGSNKKVSLEQNTNITATNTFVKALNIDIKSGSQVSNQIAGQVSTSLIPEFKENINPGKNDLKVNDNAAPLTLNLSSYGNLKLGKNAKITFTGNTNVYIKELDMDEGVSLSFNQSTNLIIDKKLDGDKNVNINPEGKPGIKIYCENEVNFGEGSHINVSLLYTKDEMHLDKASSCNRTIMRGTFIANKVESEDNVSWYWDDSYCNSTSSQYLVSDQRNPVIYGDVVRKDIPLNNYTPNKLLEVYPNPTKDVLNAIFNVNNAGSVQLQLINSLGQIMFESSFHADTNNLINIPLNVHEFPNGLYYIRISTNDGKQLKPFTIMR